MTAPMFGREAVMLAVAIGIVVAIAAFSIEYVSGNAGGMAPAPAPVGTAADR